MFLLPPQIKLALAVAALAGAAWAAWEYQANRYGAQISKIHEAHAIELAKAAEATNQKAIALAERDAKHLAITRGLQNENNTLAADVAAGRKRLHIAATCVPDPTAGTTTGTGSTGPAARLDPVAERAYSNLRAGATAALSQINRLREYASEVSNTPLPTQ